MTVCPTGWHLPDSTEWEMLINYAGGKEVAGKKLKANSGWNEFGNGTDELGFSALPGGRGSSGGGFKYVGEYGSWWCSDTGFSDGGEDYNFTISIRSNTSEVGGMGDKFSESSRGLLSVRCIKN